MNNTILVDFFNVFLAIGMCMLPYMVLCTIVGIGFYLFIKLLEKF